MSKSTNIKKNVRDALLIKRLRREGKTTNQISDITGISKQRIIYLSRVYTILKRDKESNVDSLLI